jgi:hypothetical protein
MVQTVAAESGTVHVGMRCRDGTVNRRKVRQNRWISARPDPPCVIAVDSPATACCGPYALSLARKDFISEMSARGRFTTL